MVCGSLAVCLGVILFATRQYLWNAGRGWDTWLNCKQLILIDLWKCINSYKWFKEILICALTIDILWHGKQTVTVPLNSKCSRTLYFLITLHRSADWSLATPVVHNTSPFCWIVFINKGQSYAAIKDSTSYTPSPKQDKL